MSGSEADRPAEPLRPRPGPERQAATPGGLCPTCRHVRRLVSDRGSVFWQCKLARQDPRLPRYPPQPRLVCHAWQR